MATPPLLPHPVTPPRMVTPTTTYTAALAKPALVPVGLSSSSPISTSLPPHTARAPVKHAQFDAVETPQEVPSSPTNDALEQEGRRARKSKRAERERMSRSEGGEGQDGPAKHPPASPVKSAQPRRATFSKVVSSERSTLMGLGEPHTASGPLPPRTGSYVPPQLRPRAQSSTQTPLKSLFASFDRSACPEAEDSFYTDVSSLSLDGGGSPASTAYSSPNTSRRFSPPGSAFSGFGKPSPLTSKSADRSPSTSKHAPAPPSPSTLISRGPYLDPHRFPHPGTIAEEDDEFDYRSEGGMRSWADEVDEYVDALSTGEEQALGGAFDEEGVEVRFSSGAGRRSSGFISAPGIPEDEVSEELCSGCGVEKNAAFVALVPCSHMACFSCVNALINGSAHKPPRPSDCFSCATHIDSIAPAVPGVGCQQGGVGLVVALKNVLAEEKAQQPLVSRPPPSHQGEEADTGIHMSRTRRRRSSVVAAAIAATILASSTPAKQQEGRSRSSTVGSIGSFGSLISLPSSFAGHDSFGTEPFESFSNDIGTASPSRRKSITAPDLLGYSRKLEESTHHPLSAAAPSAANVETSSEPFIPSTVDWPVIRLDNVPWEVTAAEIEEWVGEGNLASDHDEDELQDKNEQGKVKRVTLAVHILCNRADGRTLNQAYLECSSRAAARNIVRLKDGGKLRNRPVHISLSSQGEFLTTLFPTYTPGFLTLEPSPNTRSRWAAPIPLLLQTELTGLLTLCRLESAHAKKVAERPYFNIVTLLEKMPWSFPDSYNSQAVVRLFNTSVAAIEILGSIKHFVKGWKDILTVLVDAILHCPVFRPQQKQKAVRMAASIGFQQSPRKYSSFPSTFPSTAVKQTIRGGVFDFAPTSLKESYVGTAPDKGFLAAKAAEGSLSADAHLVEVGLPSPRFEPEGGFAVASSSASTSTAAVPPQEGTGNTTISRHARRKSSIARQLGVDKALIESVAAALGLTIEPGSPSSTFSA